LAGGGARFARHGSVGRWAAVGLAAVGSAPSILEVTMWPIFVPKVARSRKHKKGGPSQNAPTAHAKKHKT